MRDFTDFSLKYTRVIFYLAVFCCFLFTPVLAYEYNCTVGCHGGDGTSGDPFQVYTGTLTTAKTTPHSISYTVPYGSAIGTDRSWNPSLGEIYVNYFVSTGDGRVDSNTGDQIFYYSDGAAPVTTAPTPTITFVAGPTMQPTITMNNTTWQNVTPLVFPTIPSNLSSINCECGPLLVNFNNTLIPEETVQNYFDIVDDFFLEITVIIGGAVGILVGPVNFVVGILTSVSDSMESSLSQIQYALMPVALLMQLVFQVILVQIQAVILIVLCLDLIWVVLHGRK